MTCVAGDATPPGRVKNPDRRIAAPRRRGASLRTRGASVPFPCAAGPPLSRKAFAAGGAG